MQPEQPSGTLTLVFTDIEGSTRLLHELGQERYLVELELHRRAIRTACGRLNGYEVDYEGDSFFYAFRSAADAVAAMSEAMLMLAASPIQLRVGMHTGEPGLDPPKYVGMDVHRAARIMAAAHGGQVLLSQSAAALIDQPLRDLGEHRFKDLSVTEHVYQLGNDTFPPIRSLYRTNLPVPATAFLGRERELAAVSELLRRDGVRLVTLTGPAGTGKTRLALQAAASVSESFPDGVWWVPLAPLRDPLLVLSTIAQVLEVKEQPGRKLGETLVARLEGSKPLLVLDNAEHLLPEVATHVSSLVANCGARLLVTSRERLQLTGERVYPVATLENDAGVRLFLERAAEVGTPLDVTDDVRELCARLDQLPLALELAAARAVVFTPSQLLERIATRLDLLKAGRDADARQHTLRSTIDWSYELLDSEEQRLFRALSVFVGGCSLEAAEQVAGANADTLQSLLDKSLLERVIRETGPPRFRMLETVREYATEQLGAAPETTQLMKAHAAWFADLVELGERAIEGAEQEVWLDRLETEHDNIRSALQASLGCGDVDLARRLAASAATFWWVHGHWADGRRWLETALSLTGSDDHALRAKTLEGAAHLAARQLDFGAARAMAEECLTIRRDLEDASGIARALRVLAVVASGEGDTAVRGLVEDSARLAQEANDFWALSMALNNVGYLELEANKAERAAQLFDEALSLARERVDKRSEALFLENLGLAQLEQGLIERAHGTFAASLRIAARLGFLSVAADAIVGVAAVETARGEFHRGARLLGAARRLREQVGASLDGVEERVEARTRDEIERNLGHEEWEAAQLSGQAIDRDDLIQSALTS